MFKLPHLRILQEFKVRGETSARLKCMDELICEGKANVCVNDQTHEQMETNAAMKVQQLVLIANW